MRKPEFNAAYTLALYPHDEDQSIEERREAQRGLYREFLMCTVTDTSFKDWYTVGNADFLTAGVVDGINYYSPNEEMEWFNIAVDHVNGLALPTGFYEQQDMEPVKYGDEEHPSCYRIVNHDGCLHNAYAIEELRGFTPEDLDAAAVELQQWAFNNTPALQKGSNLIHLDNLAQMIERFDGNVTGCRRALKEVNALYAKWFPNA